MTYHPKPSMTADLYQRLCEVCRPQTPADVDAVYTVTLGLAERLDAETAHRLCELLSAPERQRAQWERAERWPAVFAAPTPDP